jgi:hypothetical protein
MITLHNKLLNPVYEIAREEGIFGGYYICSSLNLASTLTCSRNLKMEEVAELLENLRVKEVSKFSWVNEGQLN